MISYYLTIKATRFFFAKRTKHFLFDFSVILTKEAFTYTDSSFFGITVNQNNICIRCTFLQPFLVNHLRRNQKKFYNRELFFATNFTKNTKQFFTKRD